MLNAAVIIDGTTVERWQQEALDAAMDLLNVRVVLSCTNSARGRRHFKNLLYYGFNAVSLPVHLSSQVQLDIDGAEVIEFAAGDDGTWRTLPASVAERLSALGVEVVITFSTHLQRIDGAHSDVKALAYVQGEPAHSGYGPPGFYEVLRRQSSAASRVRQIGGDGTGTSWAISRSKVHHHSYKRTVANIYLNSQFLLRKALINMVTESPLEAPSTDAVGEIPSNYTVLKLLAALASRKIARGVYGAFVEKRWRVAVVDDGEMASSAEIASSKVLRAADVRQIAIGAGYTFHADPFFSSDGRYIRLEALNASNGLGEIVEVDAETLTVTDVLLTGDHHSYPFSIELDGEEYLLPEVGTHAAPYVLKWPFRPEDQIVLKGLEDYRMDDGTLVEVDGSLLLFCGLVSTSADRLYLFHSTGIRDEFHPHPLNPVVIDPRRARMGGRIVQREGRYYRFGQNNSFGYGDGVAICEITKLTPTEYEEKVVGSVRFADATGPHTVDIYGDKAVVDFYLERFSPLAWYRRIAPVVLRRRKR